MPIFPIRKGRDRQPRFSATLVRRPSALLTAFDRQPAGWVKTGTPVGRGSSDSLGYYFGSGNYFSFPQLRKQGAGAGGETQYNNVEHITFIVTSNAAQEAIWSIGANEVDANPLLLLQNNAGTLRLYFGATATYYTLGSAVIGKRHTATITYSDLSPYPTKVYLDGVLVQTINAYLYGFSSAVTYVGSGYPNQPVNVLVLQYYFEQPGDWNDAEIKNYSDNPWRIFKPDTRRIFIPSAGGGAVSLVIGDSVHGHVADTVALNWQALLSVDDSIHSHAADNLGLSTQQLLVVAEAAHTHAADSLTLGTTGSASLAIAEASHGHAADSLVLTTQWLLAIADALHAHAADNLALDTSNAVWLTLQEATHGHLADAVMLTLSSLLAIAESRHGHLADAVHLDPGQVALAIAEAVHAHLAENLTLSVVYPGVFTRAPAGSGPHLRRAIGSRPGSQNTCRHPDPGSAYPTTN